MQYFFSKSAANELRSSRRFISGALKRNLSVFCAGRTSKCIHDTLPRCPRLTLTPENRICWIINHFDCWISWERLHYQTDGQPAGDNQSCAFCPDSRDSAEVLTLLLSIAISLTLWGSASDNVLLVGCIDSLIVYLIVVLIAVYFLKRGARFKELNKFLQTQINMR